ncbi:nucleotidyltransferase domain-containing protein [Thermodesulfobacteriota bacterium]
MPVRSLNSSVIKWPDQQTVDHDLRRWVKNEAVKHHGLCKLGYFGSYARGDWGVGSDLDLIAIVVESSEPFERRSLSWDLRKIPVPADLLIYTINEWEKLQKDGGFLHVR